MFPSCCGGKQVAAGVCLESLFEKTKPHCPHKSFPSGEFTPPWFVKPPLSKCKVTVAFHCRDVSWWLLGVLTWESVLLPGKPIWALLHRIFYLWLVLLEGEALAWLYRARCFPIRVEQNDSLRVGFCSSSLGKNHKAQHGREHAGASQRSCQQYRQWLGERLVRNVMCDISPIKVVQQP